MDWKLLFSLLTTAVVTVGGWFVAHRLSAGRDRANKRRDQQVDYLIGAYRRLARAVHHPKLFEVAEDVQSAISDIQLFGSEDQIRSAQVFVIELAANRDASLDNLLNLLRDDLRRELNLSATKRELVWLRIQRADGRAQIDDHYPQ